MPEVPLVDQVDIVMLQCGCVYSAKTVVGPITCWYCQKVADGNATNSSFEYKIHRGFLYNPRTGEVTTRRLSAMGQKDRFS